MGMYISREADGCMFAVWRCDESAEELLSSIPFPQSLIDEANTFRAPHRRMEWLSVRALFYTMMGRFVAIRYHESGKPYIDDGYISISHTKGYVAVAYSATREVAIDIEQYGERVVRVARRFMNESEIQSEYDGSTTWSLLLHWSGKESVYKMVGLSAVDFAKSIIISPFSVQPSGIMEADVRVADDRWSLLRVSYMLDTEFVLTWITTS